MSCAPAVDQGIHLVAARIAPGIVGKTAGKIFRDRDELSVSSDLTGRINDALRASGTTRLKRLLRGVETPIV